MCEPLINKIMKEKHDDIPVSGFEHFSKDDVVSAVVFYKKYQDDGIVDLLLEKPNVHKLWTERSIELGFKPDIKPMDAIRQMHRYLRSYTDWLFNYCFSDVIK